MDIKSKNIGLKGVGGLDTIISRYNEDGFKATALFDNNRFYNYEMAISLSKLNLTKASAKTFFYNIKINETVMHGVEIIKDSFGKIIGYHGQANSDTSQYATDLSGEYTLAKKP
jgi:hypothetical protein